jgi:hypothetical protein
MRSFKIQGVVCGLVLAAAGSAHAEGAFDFVDPCIHVRQEFDHAKSATHGNLQAALTQAGVVTEVPPEVKDQWWADLRVKAWEYFDSKVAPQMKTDGVEPTQEAFELWLKTDIAAAGGKEKFNAILLDKYRTSLSEAIQAKRTEVNKQVAEQQSDLDSKCKMDVGNQALRVTLSAVTLPIAIVNRNLEGAKQESGFGNQVIHATTGISIPDILKYGPAGGPNSVVNDVGRFFSNVFRW